MRALWAAAVLVLVASCSADPERGSSSFDSDIAEDPGADSVEVGGPHDAADTSDAAPDIFDTRPDEPDSNVDVLEDDSDVDAPDDEDMGDGVWVDRPPRECRSDLGPDEGAGWEGWANLQFPDQVDVTIGETTPAIFGQVWQDGVTNVAGPSSGWQAELLWGPFSVDPRQDPQCWRRATATFNVDVGNNDEYSARVTPGAVGLYGLHYRFRPPGGAWRYGDLDGSDNGLTTDQAALMVVRPDSPPERIVVVTLNLRCRTDEWESRRSAVIDSLVALHPDLVALQEDCTAADGPPQSRELAEALAARLGHGYVSVGTVTHQAEHEGESFDEGLAVLTSWPITNTSELELPGDNFERKLLAVEVDLGGVAMTFGSVHFDYGANSAQERANSADLVVAAIDDQSSVVAGDLNATPDSPAVETLADALQDAWTTAGRGDGATFPSSAPSRRIDYVFVGSDWEVEAVVLVGTNDNLSDHLGVAAQLRR